VSRILLDARKVEKLVDQLGRLTRGRHASSSGGGGEGEPLDHRHGANFTMVVRAICARSESAGSVQSAERIHSVSDPRAPSAALQDVAGEPSRPCSVVSSFS